MRNYNKRMVEQKDHVSTVCNKCGELKELQQVDHFIHEIFAYPFGVKFKEGSEYEGETWNFDLCEDCLIDIIKTFKHVPDYFYSSNSEHSQEVFEEWKETGIKW